MTLSQEEFKKKKSQYLNYFMEANSFYIKEDWGASFEQYTCGLELLEELIECDPKPEYKTHKDIIERKLDELSPKINISEGNATTMSRYLACLHLGLANQTSGNISGAITNFSRALNLLEKLQEEDSDSSYGFQKQELTEICEDLHDRKKAFEDVGIKERDGVLYLSQKPKEK